jgi:O-antigen/teichoic acid export membrane protein
LQSLAATLFGQADKFIIGAMLGTAAAGRYAICVQLAAVVHMIAAAAFNFLFPQFSRLHQAGEISDLRRVFRQGMAINLALVAVLALPLLVGSKFILSLWMGRSFALESWTVLFFLTVGYALLAVNVVPYFALLGTGRIRFACVANLVGGLALMIAAVVLIPVLGLNGAALGRLVYGATVSVCYFEAVRTLQSPDIAVAPATTAS